MTVITAGDPGYERLCAEFEARRSPRQFESEGVTYKVVKENSDLIFAPVETPSLDNSYGSGSFAPTAPSSTSRKPKQAKPTATGKAKPSKQVVTTDAENTVPPDAGGSADPQQGQAGEQP